MSTSLHREAERDDAAEFLAQLAPGESITFQTFDDSSRKDLRLSRVLQGFLAEHFDTLARLNARGAGVFVMVNEGDGKGRATRNVQRIRAYFADFDGAQPPDAATQPLRPHCIIESSPSRWHWYWWVEGAPLDKFKAVQRALAERFDSDPSICDLPRVMRLPGFLHRKREPFPTRIVELRHAPSYSHIEFMRAFGIDMNATPDCRLRQRAIGASVTQLPISTRHQRMSLGVIPEGKRNGRLLSLASGLVRKGHDPQAVNKRLQKLNAEICKPPLGADEVDNIAAQAIRYGSDGFVLLPHKLLDSPEWKALPAGAHDVILTAFRRYNGANADNIALTWGDFEGREGFAKKHTFYRHRARAVASGILKLANEGRNGQTGRKPDLFAISPKWLRLPPVPKREPGPSVEKVHPYLDKQSCAAVASGESQ